jgi:hypothetical protein
MESTTIVGARARGCASIAVALAVASLVGCASPPPRAPAVDPDIARAGIEKLLPAKIANRQGWAVDIYAAFDALRIQPTTANTCAVVAVVEQESTFQVDPVVPGLPAIARRQIDARAASHGVPKVVVSAALRIPSPNGMSYGERLEHVKTEKMLSEIFDDFIRMVPLGERLFGDLNPIRTGGPMQVGIAFAEKHAAEKRYPYSYDGNLRGEVFTRRGGVYFGTAHLLDYATPYDAMLYRFADFNAGHYASRNVAFQNAVNIASKTRLALDGDLLIPGSRSPSNTELAVRKLAGPLELSDGQIRNDLEREDDASFDGTRLYKRLFAFAERGRGDALPRAMVPQIRLESPKITRKLTTEWFARRVEERYQRCLERANPGANGAR